MADFLDDAAAHTRAKHRILEEYLKAWLPILGKGQHNRLLFFDGFAGCGELKDGSPGSPLVAIRAALAANLGRRVPFEVRMVELDPERCKHLAELVQGERQAVLATDSSIVVHDPICAPCEEQLTKLLHEHAKTERPLGPALFFLDQYGYSGFSMDLVSQLLRHAKCETFSYLNWQRMHPYLTDPSKAGTLTRALGSDRWREVSNLRGEERIEQFRLIYLEALRNAGAKYVYDFAMRGSDNRLIYWLFFCTGSLKGLEVMKKAMWKVDPTGQFRYSDAFVGQEGLLKYTQQELADKLSRELTGRTLSKEQLAEFVLTQTPEYKFGDALKCLKKAGQLKEESRAGQDFYTFIRPAPKLF